jgi:GntR family transcriptional regulator
VLITRLRRADSTPCLIEIDRFSDRIGPILAADLENTPLTQTVQALTGLQIGRRLDTFQVEAAKRRDAEWLSCAVGSPLLIVDQVVYDTTGVPLYLNQQRIASTAYRYVVAH